MAYTFFWHSTEAFRFNPETSVKRYCERPTLDFTAIFAEFWLTLEVTTAFTKIQQKSLPYIPIKSGGVLVALATSSTEVSRFNVR
jgi:hypothetical protein